jgi:hypothetical protein
MNRSGFAPTTTSIRVDYPWETLPMAQFELLMALQDNQPSRIGELANQLRLAPNTVSGSFSNWSTPDSSTAARPTDGRRKRGP